MLYWKRNLALIWTSQLLSLTGYSSSLPFIPLFIKQELGITDEKQLAAAIMAYHFAGMVTFTVSAPFWGIIADRFGRKIMLLRACFLNAVFFPLMAFSPTLTVLILLRIGASFFSGTNTAAQTMIVAGTPKEHQGFALGFFSTAIWSGTMLGYLLGGILVHYFGYTTVFLLCGATYIVSGSIVLFVREDFHRVAPAAGKSGKWYRPNLNGAIWLLMLAFILTCGLRSLETPYLPVRISQLTGDETAAFWTGIVSTAAAVGGLLAGAFFGALADRRPPLQLLIPALSLSGAMLLWQGCATSVIMLATARFFAYLGAGGIEPVLQTVLARITPEEKQGCAFGFAATSRHSGMMLSTLLAGGIAYCWSVRAIFFVAAAGFWLLLPLLAGLLKTVLRPQTAKEA